MLEELLEKLFFNGKRYLGGLLGLIYGYVFINHGLMSTLIIMLTTFVGSILGDKKNIQRLKKLILDRLKEE